MNKPIGFDNHRGISFITKDGSGRAFRVVGSFAQVMGSGTDSHYRVYRGADIALVKRGGLVASNYASGALPAPATSPFSTYGTTNDVVVVTAEPHGFTDYQSVAFQFAASNLAIFNTEYVVRVADPYRIIILGPSGTPPSDWTTAVNLTASGLTNPGITGADTGTRVLVSEHPAIVVGPKISETTTFAEPWTQEVWVS